MAITFNVQAYPLHLYYTLKKTGAGTETIVIANDAVSPSPNIQRDCPKGSPLLDALSRSYADVDDFHAKVKLAACFQSVEQDPEAVAPNPQKTSWDLIEIVPPGGGVVTARVNSPDVPGRQNLCLFLVHTEVQ